MFGQYIWEGGDRAYLTSEEGGSVVRGEREE